MTTESDLHDAIREAWAPIPAPPDEDLKYMEWGWGEAAARAFVGIAPVDVDITDRGFLAATPLLDLSARVGAAYLGTFLMYLMRSIEREKAIGIHSDVIQRAHIYATLESPTFWREVRPLLPTPCREVLLQVASYLESERELLGLSDEYVAKVKALAAL